MPSTEVRPRLAECESGAVAVLFGLSVFVLALCAGLAVDYSRVLRASTQIGGAADAAALAAAKRLDEQNVTDAEIAGTAQKYFTANIERTGVHGISLGALRTTVNRSLSAVDLSIDATLQTTLGKLAGVDSIAIPVTTRAVYKARKVELAMMLDVTGSMADNDKIGALKRASSEVVDIVLAGAAPGSSPNRIALAPYSASVNAGSYAATASGGQSVDNCVFERSGSAAVTDEAPTSGRYLGVMPDPARPSNDDYSCPRAVVLPLSNDPATLKDRINSFSPAGWTSGHIGAAWAWYLVSPAWAGLWPGSSQPAAYDDDRTLKAVILMTDGKFNTFPSINMNRHTMTMDQILDAKDRQTIKSNQDAQQLCANMKAQKVLVYSVGLDTEPADEVTLRACASAPENFFSARNEAELRAAFTTIAKKLSELRIAQ